MNVSCYGKLSPGHSAGAFSCALTYLVPLSNFYSSPAFFKWRIPPRVRLGNGGLKPDLPQWVGLLL